MQYCLRDSRTGFRGSRVMTRRIGRILVQSVIAYSLASLGSTILLAALVEPHPHVPIPAFFAVVLFPVIPPGLAWSLISRIGDPNGMPTFTRDVVCLCFFFALLLPGWSLADQWITRWMDRRRGRRRESASGRHPATEKALAEGRAAAIAHLLDPEYIGDFAHAHNMKLDDVLAMVRRGELGSCVFQGIVFVGVVKSGTTAASSDAAAPPPAAG